MSRFWGDERGSVGTECVVVMCCIVCGTTIAAGFLGVAISMAAFTSAVDCLNDIANCP